MATVEIRNVRKAFGSVEVLHGVSVDMAGGEFVVLAVLLVRDQGLVERTALGDDVFAGGLGGLADAHEEIPENTPAKEARLAVMKFVKPA